MVRLFSHHYVVTPKLYVKGYRLLQLVSKNIRINGRYIGEPLYRGTTNGYKINLKIENDDSKVFKKNKQTNCITLMTTYTSNIYKRGSDIEQISRIFFQKRLVFKMKTTPG